MIELCILYQGDVIDVIQDLFLTQFATCHDVMAAIIEDAFAVVGCNTILVHIINIVERYYPVRIQMGIRVGENDPFLQTFHVGFVQAFAVLHDGKKIGIFVASEALHQVPFTIDEIAGMFRCYTPIP